MSDHSNDPVLADPSQYGFSAGLVKPYLKDEFMAVAAGQLECVTGRGL